MKEKVPVFDPSEEVRKLHSLSGEERRTKHAEFREKYAEQQESLARIQESIVSRVRENPNLTAGELRALVREETKAIGFPEEWEDIALEIGDRYIERHEMINSIRKEYPEDTDLFFALFNHRPEGRVEISERPLMLGVRCQNLRDYQYIIEHFAQSSHASSSDLERRSAAIVLRNCMIPELDGMVAVEKQNVFFADKRKRESSFDHEERHILNSFFSEGFQEFLFSPRLSLDLREIGKELDRDLKLFLYYYEVHIKDELLAYLESDGATVEVYRILTQEDGLYDYSARLRRFIREEAEQGQFNVKAITAAVEKYLVKQYQEDVWVGIEVIRKLLSLGWSSEKISSYLIREPLRKWSKVVKRLGV